MLCNMITAKDTSFGFPIGVRIPSGASKQYSERNAAFSFVFFYIFSPFSVTMDIFRKRKEELLCYYLQQPIYTKHTG